MAGLHIRSFDQLGMAQKGGAVVSDIRFSPKPFVGANKVEPGECDLYLGCDLLVAANEVNLSAASPARTIAIVSTAKVPTGPMVTNVALSYPDVDATLARIKGTSRAADSAFADARDIVIALLGDDQYANIFLVGMAAQAGALPLDTVLIEKAITLNGVAVDRNLQAFRRGRQLIADPAALMAALPAQVGKKLAPSAQALRIGEIVRSAADAALADIVQHRVGELIAYQNAGYAQGYVEQVERVRGREAAVLGSSGDITRAVARNLYKLMAYKDEYEVARLHVDPTFERTLRNEFGEGTRYSFKLHPPILIAMGLKNKISVGTWFKPVLSLMYAMRGVRGTWLDPFGHDKVRKTERALIAEYSSALATALAALTPGNAQTVCQLAESPDIVRGYGDVKLGNVVKFRDRLAGLVSGLSHHEAQSGVRG